MSDFDQALYDRVMAEMPFFLPTDFERAQGVWMDAAQVAARISAERQPVPVSDEDGGKIVRDVWIAYAKENGDTKPSHLTEWADLSEYDKEVDRRIFRAVRDALAAARIAAAKECDHA